MAGWRWCRRWATGVGEVVGVVDDAPDGGGGAVAEERVRRRSGVGGAERRQ